MSVTRLNAHEATRVPLELPHQATLGELAETANTELAQATRAARATVTHAVRAGEALLEAKEQVKHGEWAGWLRENFKGSQPLAEQLVRLAWHKEAIPPGIESWPLALKALRGLPAVTDTKFAPLPEEMRDAALRMRREGLSQRDVADILGISATTMRLWENPDAKKQRHVKRARDRRARKALRREERFVAVKQAGGPLAAGYADLRRAAQHLGHAHDDATEREAKLAINAALNRVYEAEDAIARALRLS